MNKIFFRPEFTHNINTKMQSNKRINSRDINNLSSAYKSSDINLIIKTNDTKYIISINFLNLNNNNKNNNNNVIYKSKNKQNKRGKTLSQKQSYNDLLESDFKNQTENFESILEKNFLNIQQKQEEFTQNEIEDIKNKSSQNYYQINNTTKNIIKINKKPPKIIDIKKCIINNNRNGIKKASNKYNKKLTNKAKFYNLMNNKHNLKINNNNYKINLKEAPHKKIKNNPSTVLNSHSNSKEKKFQKYLDLFEEEKI